METVVLSETINFSTSSLQTSQSGGIKKDPCNANTRSHPLRNKLAIPEGHTVAAVCFTTGQRAKVPLLCLSCLQDQPHCAATAASTVHWRKSNSLHRSSLMCVWRDLQGEQQSCHISRILCRKLSSQVIYSSCCICLHDGPQRLPVSQSSGAGSSVIERLSQHIWMSPCTKYWAVQCDPQVIL